MEVTKVNLKPGELIMTRLEKDATKRLIILGMTIGTVGIIYFFSRQFGPSLGGFGLMGLVAFVDGSRSSKCKEPKLESSDLKKIKIPTIISIILGFAFFGYILWQNAPSFSNNKIILWVSSIVFSVICITFFLIIAIRKYKKVFVKETVILPKYDEREDKVLKRTYTFALGILFGIFLLFNIIAGTRTFNKQIPGYILTLQTVIGTWLFLFILNISILWKERKLK